jgi:hypothetical protein
LEIGMCEFPYLWFISKQLESSSPKLHILFDDPRILINVLDLRHISE